MSALGLGLLTGLAQFVPIVGPIVSTIPAVLVGATQGWETALMTLGLYVAVSQLESNFITPMVQKNVANLPVGQALLDHGAELAQATEPEHRRLQSHDAQQKTKETVPSTQAVHALSPATRLKGNQTIPPGAYNTLR